MEGRRRSIRNAEGNAGPVSDEAKPADADAVKQRLMDLVSTCLPT